MRLLFVNHTSDWSGAEVALMRLITGLRDDHECAVACPAHGPLPDRLAGAGVEHLPLPAVDISFRLDPLQTPLGLAQMAAAGASLRRAARRFGADLVHANSVRAGLVAAVADRLGSPPIVVQVHDDLPASRVGRITRSAIGRTAAGIVAVSRQTARTFSDPLPVRRCEPVYISIDHTRFDPARVAPADLRAELGLSPDARLIGQVAQITPWKGQDTAIRALAGIRRELPDTHLLLVGDVAFQTRATRYDNQAYLASLHELVRDLGLGSHVHFVGRREDVPSIFAALELTMLPSWDEPFGSVTAEAMAMGTPPLVTSVGGSPEYVRDGVSGRTLPPHEPELWARAAVDLLRDPHRLAEMGRQAMADAARFTDARYAADMMAAYERALVRWRRRRALRAGGRHV